MQGTLFSTERLYFVMTGSPKHDPHVTQSIESGYIRALFSDEWCENPIDGKGAKIEYLRL